MVERFVVAVLIIVVAFALYRLFLARQMRRAAAALPGLEGHQPGKYLILYFTSPACAPCQMSQRPALKTAQGTFGDQLEIITIDVTEQPAIAERWGVMTVPTTFVFGRDGAPGACNLGVTYADKLIRQIAGLGARPGEEHLSAPSP